MIAMIIHGVWETCAVSRYTKFNYWVLLHRSMLLFLKYRNLPF